MKPTKMLAAVALIATMGMAHASTYSTYEDFGANWNDGDPGPVRFTPALFDSSLGTLTSMEIIFSGDENWTFFSANAPGEPQNAALTAQATISLIDDGFAPGPSDPGAYVANAGSLTGFGTPSSGSISGQVHAVFDVPANYLSDYTTAAPAGIAEGSVAFGERAIPGPAFPLPYESYNAHFGGTATSEFFYTPSAVPEPGSLALLGTAGVMLMGAMRLSRRRHCS